MLAPGLQIIVVFSTIFISAAVFLLARKLVLKYAERKQASYVLWGLGLWFFGLSALIEALLALNIYSTALMGLYLFLVVLVVQLLSLGSVELLNGGLYKKAYYAFSAIVALATVASIVSSPPANLMVNYVVAGLPPLPVIITSSIATFVSSAVIVGIAIKSFIKRRSWKMMSIIAGVVVVGAAGTLYIAAMPELLYYAEFLGMVFLWLGFK